MMINKEQMNNHISFENCTNKELFIINIMLPWGGAN